MLLGARSDPTASMVSVAFEETAHSRTSSQSSAVGRWLQLAHRSADSLYADLRSAAAAGGAEAVATVKSSEGIGAAA